MEQQLRDALEQKQQLERTVKQLEKQNREQGNLLEKMANNQEFQKKIKLLKEDLRMWKDKNEKLLVGFDSDDQKRKLQSERFKVLDSEAQRYQKQLMS